MAEKINKTKNIIKDIPYELMIIVDDVASIDE